MNALDWRYYFLGTIPQQATEFQEILDKQDIATKQKLLLTPLSEDLRENALTYIIADSIADNNGWRAPALTVALDEIEKLDITAAERVALLTSANELGQTVFHKALRNKEIFDLLEQRLRTWGGNDYADKFMKGFFSEPLATIDANVSIALADCAESLMPYGCEDRERLNSLCTNKFQPPNYGWPANYYPATYKGLKATVEKARAVIKARVDSLLDQGANPRLAPRTRRGELLRNFINNPDCVIKGELPVRPATPPPADKPAAPKPPEGPKP